jgi:hypothetical protein
MDKIDMSIQENVATFVTKLPKVILLCVVIYLISLNFKMANEAPKNQEVKAEVSNIVPLDAVKKYFPTCTSVEKVNEVHYVVKAGGEEIGKLFVLSVFGSDITRRARHSGFFVFRTLQNHLYSVSFALLCHLFLLYTFLIKPLAVASFKQALIPFLLIRRNPAADTFKRIHLSSSGQ